MITLKINNSWTVAAPDFNCEANIPFLEHPEKDETVVAFF